MKRKKPNKAKKTAEAERLGFKRGAVELMAVQNPGVDHMTIGVRRGVFASHSSIALNVTHDDLIGAIDDPQELGNVVVKLGILGFAGLINYNLAYGVEGLPEAAARWAGIDVDALKADAKPDKPELALPPGVDYEELMAVKADQEQTDEEHSVSTSD